MRTEIIHLEQLEKTLESDTRVSEANRGIVAERMSLLHKSFSQTNDDLRQLRKRKEELEYDIQALELEKRKLSTAPLPPKPRPKPKPKPKPAPAAVAWPRLHQVGPADTLRSLAEYYYHDAGLWERIYDANRDKIDRGLPRPGAVLSIPEPVR